MITFLHHETDRMGDKEVYPVSETEYGERKCDVCLNVYEGETCPYCYKADLMQQRAEREQELEERAIAYQVEVGRLAKEIDQINERLKEIV